MVLSQTRGASWSAPLGLVSVQLQDSGASSVKVSIHAMASGPVCAPGWRLCMPLAPSLQSSIAAIIAPGMQLHMAYLR